MAPHLLNFVRIPSLRGHFQIMDPLTGSHSNKYDRQAAGERTWKASNHSRALVCAGLAGMTSLMMKNELFIFNSKWLVLMSWHCEGKNTLTLDDRMTIRYLIGTLLNLIRMTFCVCACGNYLHQNRHGQGHLIFLFEAHARVQFWLIINQ